MNGYLQWYNSVNEWMNGYIQWYNSVNEWMNGYLQLYNSVNEWINGYLQLYNSEWVNERENDYWRDGGGLIPFFSFSYSSHAALRSSSVSSSSCLFSSRESCSMYWVIQSLCLVINSASRRSYDNTHTHRLVTSSVLVYTKWCHQF